MSGMRILPILLCFAAAAASAQPAPPAQPTRPAGPPADALRVQSFVDRAGALCTRRPAQTCVDAGWTFAAAAPGRGLTPADVATLQQRLQRWYEWRRPHLSSREQASVGFGLLLAGGMGADRLHRAFDSNGDGLVSRTELLADVTLDRRPLGKVLSDPAAVDRAGFARRLNMPAVLIDALFR